jgi:hypothetical protein
LKREYDRLTSDSWACGHIKSSFFPCLLLSAEPQALGPLVVDQLGFNLTSFRHYRAFIRSEKNFNKIAVSINDSIAKITSTTAIESLQGNPITMGSARVHNIKTGVRPWSKSGGY